MKAADLSREELFDLVWNTPMLHAAKSLGISNVMLGKICRARQVPTPPRGYWANLKSEKKRVRFQRPPLPEIGEKRQGFDKFLLDEQARRDTARVDEFDPNDLNQPIPQPPKPFEESIKDYRRRLENAFPSLVAPERIKKLHPIVQRVLAVDHEHASLRRAGSVSAHPLYNDEQGKRQLHLLNCTIQQFEDLGFKVGLTGRRHFRFFVDLFEQHRFFNVYVRDDDASSYAIGAKRKGRALSYCFVWTEGLSYLPQHSRIYTFPELTADYIKTVVLDLAVKREEEYRQEIFRRYDYRVEARKDAVQREAEREQQAALLKRRKLEQLLAHRVDLMEQAIQNMNRADQIRSLIDSFRVRASSESRPIDGLDRWLRWATHHADVLDPRHMSARGVKAWIRKFQLK